MTASLLLQTLADGRHALAALRRVQAVLAEMPPDPHIAQEEECHSGHEEERTPCCKRCSLCGGSAASTYCCSIDSGATERQKVLCQKRISQLGGGSLQACCMGRDGSHGSSARASAVAAGQPCLCTQDLPSSGRSHKGEVLGGGQRSSAVAVASWGDLELRDCWFAYPTRPGVPVLQGLSLRLACGKVTALVGRWASLLAF